MAPASPYDLAHLADDELLAGLTSLVAHDHETTARILAHVAEVDARRLYREAACASTFAYCTEILHLAEATAYKRITAARAARRFPLVFALVATGELHLSAVCLLAPHLRPDTAEFLLRAAIHRSKREVEELVAAHFPRPDAPTLVRRLPGVAPPAAPPPALPAAAVPGPSPAPAGPASGAPAAPTPPAPRPPAAAVAPLSAERFKFQFTGSRALRDKLEEVQDLLRPAAAAGDPWGRGGGDEVPNLALFCAAHDRLCAEQDYGAAVIARTITAARARRRGRADERAARGAPGGAPDPGPARPPEP